MNCVSGLVHELPERDHPEFAADCHEALPDASVVSTYPDVGEVVRRNPENEPVQVTSRRYDGVGFQIPTNQPAVARTTLPITALVPPLILTSCHVPANPMPHVIFIA